MTAAPLAGHNKWSKTKHIKAVVDKKKQNERMSYAKRIAMFSRMYGDDVNSNAQLAHAVAAATKASVPKALVEAAIARGQGRSATGAQLESMTIEILLPPNMALIADVETDNKSRTLADLKLAAKRCDGVFGSTSFYFSRRGRIVFAPKPDDGPSLSDMLEEAIELDGADDVEELPDGGYRAWTQPTALMMVTEGLSRKFGLEVLESDIIWAPNADTTVAVDCQQSVESLDSLLSSIREYPEVKAVFANVRQGAVADDGWAKVMGHIDV
ncbi:hypothetical protein CDD83_4909 [Cordyceps sp. RAO-2017]|nr:hypothetical protein CDD83_4909 [Cordyceps sp. RAO-2017]